MSAPLAVCVAHDHRLSAPPASQLRCTSKTPLTSHRASRTTSCPSHHPRIPSHAATQFTPTARLLHPSGDRLLPRTPSLDSPGLLHSPCTTASFRGHLGVVGLAKLDENRPSLMSCCATVTPWPPSALLCHIMSALTLSCPCPVCHS